MEEYDWQISKYIPEDSPKQHSLDALLHDLGMTKDTRRHPPRSLKERVQVWEENHAAKLAQAQRRILHAIGQELDYAYSLGIWGQEQTPEEIMTLHTQVSAPWRKDAALATKRYDALMRKAWRAGLSDHPLVIEWRLTYRSLGYRNLLRRAESGLERGTQAPLDAGEAERQREVLQRQAAGESMRAIYRSLSQENRRGESWQAFHKWVTRHELYVPPEPLWRIPQDVWIKLAPVIEQDDPHRATGRPRVNARMTLEAIVHKQRTGVAWYKLPAAFPDYRSVHRTFQRWQELGLLRRVWPLLQAECADLPDLH